MFLPWFTAGIKIAHFSNPFLERNFVDMLSVYSTRKKQETKKKLFFKESTILTTTRLPHDCPPLVPVYCCSSVGCHKNDSSIPCFFYFNPWLVKQEIQLHLSRTPAFSYFNQMLLIVEIVAPMFVYREHCFLVTIVGWSWASLILLWAPSNCMPVINERLISRWMHLSLLLVKWRG